MFQFARFLMQQPSLAMLLAGLLGGFSQRLLPLALLSSAIISLYILRKGARSAMGFMLVAAVIIYAMSSVITSRPGLEFPVALLLLPQVLLCSLVLRATASQGLTVAVSGLYATFMILAVQWFSGDAIAWWTSWVEVAVLGIKGATVSGFEQNGTLQILNGLIAMLLSLASLLSVLLARWMQSLVYNPGGFQMEFHHLLIPRRVLWYVFIALSALFMLNENLMFDLALVVNMMYCLQGLAIFHDSTHKKGRSNAYLIPPYLMLFIMPQFAVLGLACVGASDVFLNYRKLT